MNRTYQFLFSFLLIAAAAVFVTGCSKGPKLNAVTGKVTLDGTPRMGIAVVFEPIAGKYAAGVATTGADGAYTIYYPGDSAGIPVGEYRVKFISPDTEDGTPKWHIPAKYNANTEITVTIEAGKNEYDFDLNTH